MMSNSGDGISITRKLCWFKHDFSLAKRVKKVRIKLQSSAGQDKPKLKCCTTRSFLALF